MSGDRQYCASSRDIERNIQEAKDIARRAFNRKLGTHGLTALQKGFYNRFLELESQSCHVESNRSTSSCGRRPRSISQQSLLRQRIGKLHSELSTTYKKYAHLAR